MVRIVWSLRALADIETIRDYVREFAPMAATRLVRRLRDAAESLRDYPHRGRPAGGTRRDLIVVPPYIIRYRLLGDEVTILTVWHGARNQNRP